MHWDVVLLVYFLWSLLDWRNSVVYSYCWYISDLEFFPTWLSWYIALIPGIRNMIWERGTIDLFIYFCYGENKDWFLIPGSCQAIMAIYYQSDKRKKRKWNFYQNATLFIDFRKCILKNRLQKRQCVGGVLLATNVFKHLSPTFIFPYARMSQQESDMQQM